LELARAQPAPGLELAHTALWGHTAVAGVCLRRARSADVVLRLIWGGVAGCRARASLWAGATPLPEPATCVASGLKGGDPGGRRLHPRAGVGARSSTAPVAGRLEGEARSRCPLVRVREECRPGAARSRRGVASASGQWPRAALRGAGTGWPRPAGSGREELAVGRRGLASRRLLVARSTATIFLDDVV